MQTYNLSFHACKIKVFILGFVGFCGLQKSLNIHKVTFKIKFRKIEFNMC